MTLAPPQAGKGKNYTYMTRVEVTRDEWLKDGDAQVGQVIKCQTIKNKTAPPRRTARWTSTSRTPTVTSR